MQRGASSIQKNSTHMHILIWLYDSFSRLDPIFDFAKHVIQACYLFILYPELHQKDLLVGRKEATQCLGEESYTFSDLRESFEE